MSEDFKQLREYVDACIDPDAAPNHLKGTLTIDPRPLHKMIDAFDAELERAALPKYRSLKDIPKAGSANNQKQGRHQKLLDDASAFQRKVLARLRRDIEKNTVNGVLIPIKRLNWVILPHGAAGLSQVRHYCEQLGARNPQAQVEMSRIEYVYGLTPDATYCGVDEFDGYLVFYFRSRGFAVLECPLVGNALYVIYGDWVSLSRMTKTDLLRSHASQVTRIIHSYRWRYELEQIMSLDRE